MTKKIALITGANKGIGFETARLLGEAGMTVLVGARSAALGERAAAALAGDGIDARFVHIDVTDHGTVDAAAAWIEKEHGRLDILVNNAAIAAADASGPGAYTLPSDTSAASVRAAFETNVIGVVAVTAAMLPLLRRSPAGRIVNVSSELGSLERLSDPSSPAHRVNLLPYNASKSALNAVTLAYAKELADGPIKVNAATPGHCATDLNGHTGPRPAAVGAAVIAGAATLGADGPTGVFITDAGPEPW
ncbi:SDR family NAD(P)-dependent oxidoreductase [Actinomadura graeca]|uniref:SDR family NAD(P)-dependent oxidoreductase n=1 Tax=Actinomadura graeca TaxID=2750812 RepID=A0ABX8QR04_9ACTN|nr:SDR family NAD(P)-dependent oxidoreductase [Actinomadura graeca]QXJ20861.1 SDR family NAD(P)-dependent oxidoreductase [Actinomadura graeca]